MDHSKTEQMLTQELTAAQQRLADLEIKQKATAADLAHKEIQLEMLHKLGQMGQSLHEIINFTLEQAINITASKIGYLAFMNEDESTLTMYAWSKTAMKECNIIDKPIVYPIETTGLWGEAVRQRRPIITNDYAAPNPHKKGYPEGHVPIIRHMNVPVFDNERIVAVIGVGNKEEAFTETDIQQLTLLMDGMWRVVARNRAEEESLQSEEKYRRLIETTNTGFVVVDEQGNVLDANKIYIDLLGYSSLDEIRGRNVTTWTAPYEIERNAAAVKQCFKQGFIKDLEIDYIRPDERIVPVEINATIINDKETTQILSLVHDITKRKQAEQTLKESEMNFRGFAEASSYGFGMGQLTGQLVFANQSLLAMLDEQKLEDAYAKTFYDYYTPADQERLRNEILPIVLQKGQWIGEIPLLSSKRRLTPTEQNIFLIYNEQGQPRLVGNIITNITDRLRDIAERDRLQQEIIEIQRQAIAELSTPIIPIMDGIIVVPLVGSIDSGRARDITRNLLAGIGRHYAKVVILDITGVSIMDSSTVNHLNKTIQAARLKGARTIVTGVSDMVAESIVDLGIDWSESATLSDLQTGLLVALNSLGVRLTHNHI